MINHDDYDSEPEIDPLQIPNGSYDFNTIESQNETCQKPGSSEKKRIKRRPIEIYEHVTILSGDPPLYQCNVCSKKFKTRAHIRYHEFCQKGEKPFKCEECGQSFIAKSHYEYHLRTHTGERPYSCPKCGKGFNQRGKVTRHMLSHTGEKPYKCQQCGRGFANAQALRSHFLIHTGERPYSCNYCTKRFTGMTNLKKHMITHTGDRPFGCTICGKSFGLKWTLDLHLRTHSNERPFSCDQEQCHRSFSNMKDLRRHAVIHSGERPFICWICGTAFRRKDNLNRHIKNTHHQPKEVAFQLANEAAAEYLSQQANKLVKEKADSIRDINGKAATELQQPIGDSGSAGEISDENIREGSTVIITAALSPPPPRSADDENFSFKNSKKNETQANKLHSVTYETYGDINTDLDRSRGTSKVREMVKPYQAAIQKAKRVLDNSQFFELPGNSTSWKKITSVESIAGTSRDSVFNFPKNTVKIIKYKNIPSGFKMANANLTSTSANHMASKDAHNPDPVISDTVVPSTSITDSGRYAQGCDRFSSNQHKSASLTADQQYRNVKLKMTLAASGNSMESFVRKSSKIIENIRNKVSRFAKYSKLRKTYFNSSPKKLSTGLNIRKNSPVVKAKREFVLPWQSQPDSLDVPGVESPPLRPNPLNSDILLSNEGTMSNNVSQKDPMERKRVPVKIFDHINVLKELEEGRKMYECLLCKKKFKTRAHIKYHEFCGNVEKPYKCKLCGNGFIAKSHYEYHMRTHTGVKPYACSKCGKRFNQKGKVTRHMKSHTGEKPFGCLQCGRSFSNAQALRSHFLIHTGERPFKCKYCKKGFTTKTSLSKHSASHTDDGERTFVCTICNKGFQLKWGLDLHLRTHSAERPYACDQCSRAFGNKKDLRRHEVIHSGERPFKCWICGTAFRRKDNLDRHIKNTHHQPKEVPKELIEAAEEHLKSRAQLDVSNFSEAERSHTAEESVEFVTNQESSSKQVTSPIRYENTVKKENCELENFQVVGSPTDVSGSYHRQSDNSTISADMTDQDDTHLSTSSGSLIRNDNSPLSLIKFEVVPKLPSPTHVNMPLECQVVTNQGNNDACNCSCETQPESTAAEQKHVINKLDAVVRAESSPLEKFFTVRGAEDSYILPDNHSANQSENFDPTRTTSQAGIDSQESDNDLLSFSQFFQEMT